MCSRLIAELTLEGVDDFFTIGKKPAVESTARSKTGGRPLDPSTGKPAVYQPKPVFLPPYRRYVLNLFAENLYWLSPHTELMRNRKIKEYSISSFGWISWFLLVTSPIPASGPYFQRISAKLALFSFN